MIKCNIIKNVYGSAESRKAEACADQLESLLVKGYDSMDSGAVF